MNVDGLTMFVSSTAANGVVGGDTRLRFRQLGSRVIARYGGGSIARGVLVGSIDGNRLVFRYGQVEVDGAVQGGRSVCEVERRANGRLRIIERFTWTTRSGNGVNVFDELPQRG